LKKKSAGSLNKKVFTNMNYFCLGPIQKVAEHKFSDYEGPQASNRFVDLN